MSSVCNEKSVSPSTGKHIYKSCLEGTCGVQPVMGSDPSILENLTYCDQSQSALHEPLGETGIDCSASCKTISK